MGFFSALGSAVGGAVFGEMKYNRQKRDAQTASNTAFKRNIHARRTEYQDKVHSLEAAGLNRILAAGGQPTPANAPQSQTPDRSSEKIDVMGEYLMKSQANAAQSTAKSNNMMATKLAADAGLTTTQNDYERMKLKMYKDNPNLLKTKLYMDAIGIGAAGVGAAATGAAAARLPYKTNRKPIGIKP